ncbi:MAG: folate hydrolase, partial [Gammaproteobacteria bacterium]|nr:folate hydrolase [Gammaproteobacteria bacterium]
HAEELQQKAVAYVNSGVTTQGYMNAGGSHSLETLVDGLTKVVTDPKLGVTVYDRVAARIEFEGDVQHRSDLASSGRYRLAPLGLGSDFTPFLQHLGIPSLDIAFDGEADNGVYHSVYDNFDFYDRFGDPGYEYGVKLAEFGGRLMLRLANANVLPFEFSGMAHALSQYAGELQKLTDEMRSDIQQHNLFIEQQMYQLLDDPKKDLIAPVRQAEVPQIDFEPITLAVKSLSLSADRFLTARTALEASGKVIDSIEYAWLNAILARAEQALAPAHGLPGRPWYRHHVYAPGYYTGYAVKTLPSVREAIELKNWKEVRKEIITVGNLIEAYAVEIDKASLILEQATM